MTTIPVEKATLSVAEMATLVGICVNTAYTYLETAQSRPETWQEEVDYFKGQDYSLDGRL